MLTMDFTQAPEPSRQGIARFEASEIFRLWGEPINDVHRLVRRLHSQTGDKRYRVAAMLPDQELEDEDFAVLERNGVLLVEVPEELSEESNEKLAAYLTAELVDAGNETRQRMAAMGTSTSVASHEDDYAVDMTDVEEAEFLEFVNDPANQLGGHL